MLHLHVHHWWEWLLYSLPVFGQFGFDFGDSGTGDPGFLQGLISFLIAVIQYIWSALVAVANYLWAVLQFVWNFLLTIFKDIANALKWVWEKIVKVALTKAIGAFLKVRQWLSNLLSPVIRLIKHLRAIYDQYFNQFVKPILKIIRQMRQFLQIFKLLGFKWAKRLDADLASIENKIVKAYTTLRGYLNVAISWIDLIVDPLGILRRNPLFASLIRSAPELQNMLDRATQRDLTNAESEAQRRNKTWFTASSMETARGYWKSGQLPPDDAAIVERFKAVKLTSDGLQNG